MSKFSYGFSKVSAFCGLKNLYNIKVISMAALFVAISVLAGKFLAIPRDGSIRFSLENFPILLTGMLFGPIFGAFVGVLADFIGCIIMGFAINPIIMAGCASVGFISGLLFKLPIRKVKIRVLISVFVSHIFGSICVKSIGLWAYYGYNLPLTFFWRTINYAIIGCVEFFLIYLLLKNKNFMSQINHILE